MELDYNFKPASKLTIEELKADNKRLSAMIKADREARGLPPEPPADFVSVAMAWTLYERCQPLHEFAIKYAQLCDKANEILDITDEQLKWVQSFRPNTKLITNVKDATILKIIGAGLDGLISTLDNRKEYEDVSELLRSFHTGFHFSQLDYGPPRICQFTYLYNASNEENEQYRKEIYEEIERLKDDNYFEAEFKRLKEHHESIKHLY